MTELTELPAPANAFSQIGPSTPLQITVTGDEGLSGTYIVDEEGMLLFPYIGRIAAQGLSPTQLAAVLRARLSGDFILDPAVTVSMVDAIAPTVSIGGEIETPGNYPISQSYTLLRAINTAGGLAEYADSEDVLVFRTVDGQRFIGLYNAGAIARGNYPDPNIFAGDIVMVGENAARRRFESILGILPAITSSIVLLDRVAN
ncbi:hypothetical protein AAW01_10195 [Aurantiacibacter gangjinensis]|uniref:Uncharacterized protein n=1 Tax=Aurantiacibacter gangjinensis TaxID=502682 RepID=A0A0G9MNG7_9SPHN|nr:hypothetical protein AAW01_10195 [Aurantiacibacter gangjinensis]